MATVKSFPLQQVLELACAAERFNKGYVKQVGVIVSDDNKVMGYTHANKTLMLAAIGEDHTTYTDPLSKPAWVRPNLEDRDLATEIQKFYRRLMFVAIEGSNEFQTELNQLLTLEIVPMNKFGFIACLPNLFKRDWAKNNLEKRIKQADDEYLAGLGADVLDKDCEILTASRSKNFDAWNIDAIIDNKMVSWMSKNESKLGPAVLVKAKVKDHTVHWKYENKVTRLNYVKVVQ